MNFALIFVFGFLVLLIPAFVVCVRIIRDYFATHSLPKLFGIFSANSILGFVMFFASHYTQNF